MRELSLKVTERAYFHQPTQTSNRDSGSTAVPVVYLMSDVVGCAHFSSSLASSPVGCTPEMAVIFSTISRSTSFL